MESKEIRQWQDEEALKRYRMIAPLLDPDIDEAKRRQLRKESAEKNAVSVRSLYRYEAGYRSSGFNGLRPMNREKRRSQSLPENFDEIVGEAIQLKREVPSRSTRQIIKILEIEGWAPPGVLKVSTMQRYLYKAGLGKKQMRRYTEKRESSSRRFCKPHRMMLIQGDIKNGPEIRTKDGTLIKTYLSSLLDDHSRYILQSEFYDNERKEIVEDTFHKAIIRHGVFDAAYLDNGSQYISEQLEKSCARLGIRLLHAKPKACESKGKIEKFHQVVDKFIAEIRIAHVHSLEELNRRWKVMLEMDYQRDAHGGIAEYYRSQDVEVPKGGISPQTEWMRDERMLTFMDVSVVAEAFLHHEERQIDKAGCFSFEGRMYEASVALAGCKVEIVYDPMNTETITVNYPGTEPVLAHRVRIGAFADKKPPLPAGMTTKKPERSRFLDALEKKYNEEHHMMANALSFGDYGREGEDHV